MYIQYIYQLDVFNDFVVVYKQLKKLKKNIDNFAKWWTGDFLV